MNKMIFYSAAFILYAFQSPSSKERTIRFSGYVWTVRSNINRQGPGPNYFNDRCVWVDKQGFLHLVIQKDSATGNWFSAEVTTKEGFGFGAYEFTVEGGIDKFDKNLVLGLFNYSGNDGFDELDIEFARWGNDRYPNLNYTVWPAEKPFRNYSYTKEFSIPGIYTTQRFLWTKDSVVFTSREGIEPGKQSLIATNTCKSPPNSISQRLMPVHINFWLFEGQPPVDGKTKEIIIQHFIFKGS
jgi:hypothetical protein